MQKGQLLEVVLEQQEVVHKDGWNVATSQRRDVESTYKEVNKRQRRDAPTSRRPNVATSQRRDVPTSRRQHEFLLSIIKRQMGTEFERIGDWESHEPGRGNQSCSDIDPGEEPVILYSSLFWILELMFYISPIGIFLFIIF